MTFCCSSVKGLAILTSFGSPCGHYRHNLVGSRITRSTRLALMTIRFYTGGWPYTRR